MAFSLDTTSILAITALRNLPEGAPPVSGLTAQSKDLISSVTENRAALFNNPLTDTISGVTSQVNSLTATLTAISTGAIINPNISAGAATAYLAGGGIGNLQTSMSNFLGHTNRLSGTLKGAGISAPGLEQVLSIGKSMNDMANVIDGAKGCLNIVGGMTGIFSGDDIDAAANEIAKIVDQINKGIATIADITATVVGIATIVNAIIDKDSKFIENSIEQLKSAALAMAIGAIMKDPCGKFIMETVGTDTLLKKLT
jgi:hypothetical protein